MEIIENKPIAEPDHDDEDYQRFLETLEQVQGGEYKELENIETYQINIIAALVQKIHRDTLFSFEFIVIKNILLGHKIRGFEVFIQIK